MNKLFDDLVTIQFSTAVTVSPRTIVVAEAFGLGIDEQKDFQVFDEQLITIYEHDVVYISGDSGGGKSSLLRYLHQKIGGSILSDMIVDPEEVLVEGVGKTVEESLKILTRSGLGDAFLMLRKYKELSDGQKYRYLIAKLISSEASVWFIDEFCATLDRTLAKILAYSIQKLARELNKTLIVATTHNDLFHDLNPSLYISKSFGGRVRVDRNAPSKLWCSITPEVSFKLGTYQDYENSGLSFFHYKNDKRPAGLINVYMAIHNSEIIGALLTRYPALEIRERNIITDKKYVKNYKVLNEEVEMISRVVIHSKYRGIGLGTLLVKSYLESPCSKQVVETMAVMAHYNPFFERAGMTRIRLRDDQKKIPTSYKKLLETLTGLGFDLTLTASLKYNRDHLATLSEEQKKPLLEILMKEYNRINHLYDVDNKERLQKVQDTIQKTLSGDYTIEFLSEVIKKTRRPELAYCIWFKNAQNNSISTTVSSANQA